MNEELNASNQCRISVYAWAFGQIRLAPALFLINHRRAAGRVGWGAAATAAAATVEFSSYL